MVFYSLAKEKCVKLKIRFSQDDKFTVVHVHVLCNKGVHKSGRVNYFEYRIATGSSAGFVQLWRIRVYERARNLLWLRAKAEYECEAKLQSCQSERREPVSTFALLPDKRSLATVYRDSRCEQTLRVWNVDTREYTMLHCWLGNSVEDVL